MIEAVGLTISFFGSDATFVADAIFTSEGFKNELCGVPAFFGDADVNDDEDVPAFNDDEDGPAIKDDDDVPAVNDDEDLLAE